MKLDWGDIDIPWLEREDFVDLVLDKLSILDILDKYEIEYFPASTAEFGHKMRCPFPKHHGGAERTASCFVSHNQESFFCFGCNTGSNAIDFIVALAEVPYHRALEIAASIAKISGDETEFVSRKRQRRDPEQTMLHYVFKSGEVIREWLKDAEGKTQYDKYCRWADKRFVELDGYLDKDDDEWQVSKDYYERLCKRIK